MASDRNLEGSLTCPERNPLLIVADKTRAVPKRLRAANGWPTEFVDGQGRQVLGKAYYDESFHRLYFVLDRLAPDAFNGTGLKLKMIHAPLPPDRGTSLGRLHEAVLLVDAVVEFQFSIRDPQAHLTVPLVLSSCSQ
jgi:hypothetical protein